jgi:hypothetical protein
VFHLHRQPDFRYLLFHGIPASLFFLGSFSVVFIWKLLVGEINLDYLLHGVRPNGSKSFSPGRVQLLVATIIAPAGHPVRIQGQLFVDGSHTPCHGDSRPKPKRVSLWEIFPVYSVEVCGQSTIAEYQSASAGWAQLNKFLSSE